MSVFDSTGRELCAGQKVARKVSGSSPSDWFVKKVGQPGNGTIEGYVILERPNAQMTVQATSKEAPIQELTIV